MITIRELNADDSNACIILKKERQHTEPLEIRKNNFFKIYNALSYESFSYGAFFDKNLIGLCSFIKIKNKDNLFLVTDLTTSKSFENQRIPLKIFDYANQKLFLQFSNFSLMAVEEKLKALELLKFVVNAYSLTPNEDQLIYSHLFKISALPTLPVDSFKFIDTIHPLDMKGQMLVVEEQEVVFFTDETFRSYCLDNKIMNRLYISGLNISNLNIESVAYVLAAAHQVMEKRSLDYLVILSEDRLDVDADFVYVNRFLSFSQNASENISYDLSKGILI